MEKHQRFGIYRLIAREVACQLPGKSKGGERDGAE